MPAAAGPSYAALKRHNKRIQAMFDDPACVGDLLLAGVALAWMVDINRPERLNIKAFRLAARPVFPPNRYGRGPLDTLLTVLRADIRRYSIEHDPDSRLKGYWDIPCGAPMIKRSGPCGQHATDREEVADHDTGRRRYIGACSRPEHKKWLREVIKRNQADGNEAPVPAANAGGVLARHLPEIDWYVLYRYLDSKWGPPPEESPWRPPTLSLHLGDAEPTVADSDRPALAVVTGAGERINIDGPREGQP